jgi:hypothetical protein
MLAVRFRDEVHDLVSALVGASGGVMGAPLSQSQVVEAGLRLLAEKWGVAVGEAPVPLRRHESRVQEEAALEAKMRHEWATPREQARGLRAAGWTFARIGTRLGVSRQRAEVLCRPDPPAPAAGKIHERNGSAEPGGAV